MKPNQISAEVTSETVDLVFKKLDEIAALFPFLISLTPEEKQGGFKPGDVNVAWLAKAKDYINQAPQFMPSYVNVPESMKDLNVTTNFSVMLKKMSVLYEKMQDTFTQAGYEALLTALAYYDSVKRAADNNILGAQTIYDDLKKRFPGKNKSDPTTPAK